MHVPIRYLLTCITGNFHVTTHRLNVACSAIFMTAPGYNHDCTMHCRVTLAYMGWTKFTPGYHYWDSILRLRLYSYNYGDSEYLVDYIIPLEAIAVTLYLKG